MTDLPFRTPGDAFIALPLHAATSVDTVSEIRWPWVAPILIALVLLAGLGGWYAATKRKTDQPTDALWVANSDYVGQIPKLTSWIRRYRLLQWAGVGALCTSVVAASFIASRPTTVTTSRSELSTRDIVLCLDVSGSMIGYDQEVLDVFTEIVEQFDGERIALQIFNSTSQTVFPLTDDYGLVLDQLDEGRAALDPEVAYTEDEELLARFIAFTSGTLGNPMAGSSLIGDGLASCALVFDETATERSRSIVFATDNDLRGDPVYTLQQAADLATSRGIAVNGLYGALDGESDSSDLAEEYRKAIESTDGQYFFTEDPKAVDAIVADILSDQAVALDSTPEITRADKAGPWFFVVGLGLITLVLVQWRLRE